MNRRTRLSPPAFVFAALAIPPASSQSLLITNQLDDSVTIVDARSGQIVSVAPTGPAPGAIAVSPDGSRAAIANWGRDGVLEPELSIVDVATGRTWRDVRLGGLGEPARVRWTGEAEVELVGRDTGRRWLVDVSLGRLTGEAPPSADGPLHVLRSPSRRGVSMGPPRVVSVRAPAPGDLRVDVTLTPDGRHGLVPMPDGRELLVFDRSTGAIRRLAIDPPRAPHDGAVVGPRDLLVLPGQRRALLALNGHDDLAVIDLRTFRVVSWTTAGRAPSGLGWSSVSCRPPEPFKSRAVRYLRELFQWSDP